MSVSLILVIVVIVETFADAESHHVVVGIGKFDGASPEIHVDTTALSRPVIVVAPSASLGWSAGGGVVVLGQLSLPGLGSASGHLVGGLLSGSGFFGAASGDGRTDLGVVRGSGMRCTLVVFDFWAQSVMNTGYLGSQPVAKSCDLGSQPVMYPR